MSAVDDVLKYTKFLVGSKNFTCDKNKNIGYRFYHSRLVANLCIFILENCLEEDIPKTYKSEMFLRKDIICIAALLHDIKKDEKHHAEKAADNLENIFEEISKYTGSSEILKIEKNNILIIKEMIRKHGSHGSCDDLRKYYIRLIQDADNISRYVNYLPKEVFYNIFDIRKDVDKYTSPKRKVKEKHKKLNYKLSKRILKLM